MNNIVQKLSHISRTCERMYFAPITLRGPMKKKPCIMIECDIILHPAIFAF